MTGRALIARADNGGLGNQTWALAQHVSFDKILIVHADHYTRGRADLSRYEGLAPEVRSCPAQPGPHDAAWLLSGSRVVFTAETWYKPSIPLMARQQGVRAVIQANPEFWTREEMVGEVWLPSRWEQDRMPGNAVYVQVPVDRERLQVRDYDQHSSFTFLHIHSNAMEDRNGTRAVLAACEQMTQRCQLLIRGGRMSGLTRIGPVLVQWLGPYDGPYWEMYPSIADCLVLPRRFGGLCLPMQEAAALGMPILTTDLSPQRSWIPYSGLVPTHSARPVRMKGGEFEVHDVNVPALAARMDRMVGQKAFWKFGHHASLAWADSLDWKRLAPEYEALL
jgi:hypothetical protein